MFAAALIVFREVLEASLIIGIVMAACRGIPHRSTMAIGGISAGLLGAVVIAAAAGKIAGWASGMGQEILNAGMLGFVQKPYQMSQLSEVIANVLRK